jgi:hypothetical protein
MSKHNRKRFCGTHPHLYFGLFIGLHFFRNFVSCSEHQSHHPRFSQEKTLSSLSQKSTMEMNSIHLSAVSRRALEHKTPAHAAGE